MCCARSPIGRDWFVAWTESDVHRDVRVAVLRALWDMPEREAAWRVFEEAARSTDPAVAAGVIRIPADRLSSTAQRRLARLLSLLLRHGEAKIRLDTLKRCASLPVADTERALLQPVLNALRSMVPDEVKAAASARSTWALSRLVKHVSNASQRW